MRALLVGLVAIAPATASAVGNRIESSVTIALTLTNTGPAQFVAGKRGAFTNEAPLLSWKLGNKQILEALVAKNLITAIAGWKIIAVWASWPEGDTYRFFAKRGNGTAAIDLIAIPDEVLDYGPIASAASYKFTGSGAAYTGGSESYQVSSWVTFRLPSSYGVARGLRVGTGRYRKAKGASAADYVPDASKVSGNGEFYATNAPWEWPFGVVTGTVSFGGGVLTLDNSFTVPRAGNTSGVGIINVDPSFPGVSIISES